MNANGEIIYAFIDSQNLRLSVQNDILDRKTKNQIYQGWEIDYRKFLIYLKDMYKVDKVFLFIGKMTGNEKLYNFLEGVGYTVIYKPCVEYSDDNGATKVKGNVDAELVLHSMVEFPIYHKAIIVSGDGDYYCLLEYLVKQNKLFKLIIPNHYSFSSLLRTFANYAVFVTNLRGKLERKYIK